MSDPTLAFQAAEDAALRASAALLAAVGEPLRLYTEVPVNAVPPYTVIGQHEVEVEPDEDGCGASATLVTTVQWWTRAVGEVKGSKVARLMGAAIVEALLGLEITGHRVDLCAYELPATYGTDPDGSSRGRVAFRYETTPTAG